MFFSSANFKKKSIHNLRPVLNIVDIFFENRARSTRIRMNLLIHSYKSATLKFHRILRASWRIDSFNKKLLIVMN